MKMGYEWVNGRVKYSHYRLKSLLPSYVQPCRKEWLRDPRKDYNWGKKHVRLGIEYINFPYSKTTTTGYFT